MLKLVPSSRPRYCMMLFIVLLSGSDFATRASPYFCGYFDSRMARNKCLSCIFFANLGGDFLMDPLFFLCPFLSPCRAMDNFNLGVFQVTMAEVRDWKTLQGFDFLDEGASASPSLRGLVSFVAPFFAPKVCPWLKSFK